MASRRQDGDKACDWRAAIEVRVSALEDLEARVSALEDKQAENSGSGGANAITDEDPVADEPIEVLESGQFGVVLTEDDEDVEDATDDAIIKFLSSPKKANELGNELYERFALDKERDVVKARKRLPGAIVDSLMSTRLQETRAWPGDGKASHKREIPALLARFVRNVIRACGETDLGRTLDKRISVMIHHFTYIECPNSTVLEEIGSLSSVYVLVRL